MTTNSTPLCGERLIKTAVNWILENPEKWDQQKTHSDDGTKHNIIGCCQILAGLPANSNTAGSDVKRLLALTAYEELWLWDPIRTIDDLYRFAKNYSEARDRDGFNQAGFDLDGHDQSGMDCDGFDRNGFDRNGFNRDGFDMSGFNIKGLDREGRNRGGRDKDGRDRNGNKLAPFDL